MSSAAGSELLLGAQRVIVLGLVVVSAVAIWRGSLEVFNLLRLTLVLLGAVALVALSAVRAARTGTIGVVRSPVTVLAAAFVVALLVATVVADGLAVPLLGAYGRNAGALAYAAYAVVLLVTIRAFRPPASLWSLAWAVTAGVGLVTAYGLVQVAGGDPFEWDSNGLSTAFSTLGQVNYAAGYVAIALPAVACLALRTATPTTVRLALGALVTAAIAFALETDSFQGPVAITAGLAIVAVAVLLEHRARLRGRALVAAGAVGLAGLALGFVALGPAIASNVDEGLFERRSFWRAALSMAADSPVWGHGLGSFGRLFPSHRPAAHATFFGLSTTDDAHSVPLNLLAGGGLLLLVAYLAVVTFVGWTLVNGLRRLRGDERLLLSGIGGGWVAYQVQSLVSIDAPAIALLHWVLAGAVVALAKPPAIIPVDLPAAGALALQPKRARPGSGAPWATGAVAVLALGAAWLALQPLRADLAAGRGASGSDLQAATASLRRATSLAPWESRYHGLLAATLANAGRLDEAVIEGELATRSGPSNVRASLDTARLYEALGDVENARQWYEEALRRDPEDPDVSFPVGEHYLRTGDPALAVPLLEDAARYRDGVEFELALASAHRAVGDLERARALYQQVLEVNPTNEEALEGVAAT